MNVDDLFIEGGRTVDKNRQVLYASIGRYAAYIIMLVCYLVCLAVTVLLFKCRGNIVFAVYAVSSLFGVAVFAFASSFFTAAITGIASDAIAGKRITADSFVGWGRRKWVRVLIVDTAFLAFYLLLLLLFAPAAILLIYKHLALAFTFGLAAAAIAFALALAANFLLMPVAYLAVIRDKPLKSVFRESAEYVKKNPWVVIILWALSMLLTTLLNSLGSLLTGPPQVIPYVGIVVSILLMVLIMPLTGGISEALSTVWWVMLLRKRQ